MTAQRIREHAQLVGDPLLSALPGLVVVGHLGELLLELARQPEGHRDAPVLGSAGQIDGLKRDLDQTCAGEPTQLLDRAQTFLGHAVQFALELLTQAVSTAHIEQRLLLLRLRYTAPAFVLTQPGGNLSQLALQLGDGRAGGAPQCRLPLAAGGLLAFSRSHAYSSVDPLLLGLVEVATRAAALLVGAIALREDRP